MYIQRYVCSDLSGYVHVKMFTAGFNPICLWFCVRVLVEGLYIYALCVAHSLRLPRRRNSYGGGREVWPLPVPLSPLMGRSHPLVRISSSIHQTRV